MRTITIKVTNEEYAHLESMVGNDLQPDQTLEEFVLEVLADSLVKSKIVCKFIAVTIHLLHAASFFYAASSSFSCSYATCMSSGLNSFTASLYRVSENTPCRLLRM